MMDDGSNIFKMVDMLTQICLRSINHYMARIRREAENTGQPISEFVPLFLDSQWNRIVRLLMQAAALPGAQVKAAELALYVDRLATAMGRFAEWRSAVEPLATVLDEPGTDNRLQLAELWACVARCYQYMGDASRASIVLGYAEDETADQGEAGADLARALRLTKGGVRITQLRYEDAVAIFGQFLEDAEMSGDPQTALFGHDLAAYFFLHVYDSVQAFDHAQQAFVLAIALNDTVSRLRGLHCMAEALRIGERTGQANRYLRIALEQARELNNQPWLAYLEYCFGTQAVTDHNFPEAIDRLTIARGMFKATSNRPGEINSIESLGFALMQAGRFAEAEPVLLEAIRGLKEIKNAFELAQTHYGLGMAYAGQGRAVLAREAWYEARHQLNDLEGEHVQGLLDKIADAFSELDGSAAPA